MTDNAALGWIHQGVVRHWYSQQDYHNQVKQLRKWKSAQHSNSQKRPLTKATGRRIEKTIEYYPPRKETEWASRGLGIVRKTRETIVTEIEKCNVVLGTRTLEKRPIMFAPGKRLWQTPGKCRDAVWNHPQCCHISMTKGLDHVGLCYPMEIDK